jgi:anti-sigma regulatory factor (Ser/Thr protein kinase)
MAFVVIKANDIAGARQAVREVLSGYADEVVETAALLASELVTNGIAFGDRAAILRIRPAADRVRVEVSDRNPSVMDLAPLHPEPEDESGRGLLLVHELASSWGVEPRAAGKTVWFELAL